MIYDFERACQASLERSRARRLVVARHVAAIRRRRRRRGSGTSVAVVGVLLALGGPLALAQTSAQAPAPGMLSAGSSGNAVSALQAALGIKQTGRFSAATARAVRAYQRENGLTVDGIVGPQTAGALKLASGPVASTPKAVAASAGSGSAGSATLDRIAACESGGDPTAVSADGRYRGKYQFSRATWRAVGGSGDPAAAPEAEQDRRAAALLAAQGTTPWPACGQ